uniref:amino acid transporter AVT1C-like isoform X1 n=1 Tax=Styela clava TaxID=7725 RepID=UPI00193AA9EB|nr:amino acid transporter AVT1C-like isoform X1 [Styela clava]
MSNIMQDEAIAPLLEIGTKVKVDKRYGIGMAAVFIIGTLCGSGVLAIPQAIVDGGLIAMPLLVICGLVSAFTGTLLGKSWIILRERYPEYEANRVTDPYPTIAFRAAGKVGEYATRVCLYGSLFGGGTVFLLLISDNTTNLLQSMGGIRFYPCYMMMIVFCILTPLSWIGTPKDFWYAGLIAAATTTIGALLIVAGIVQDAPEHVDSYRPEPTASSFFNSFGVIVYAFGGASCFPTIQVDMKNPNKFNTAVVLGIIGVIFLYFPAGAAGYFVFGNDMKPNVLSALSPGWISYTINILITSHLLMAFVIISNPVTQEIEGFLNIPEKFTWKRVMTRTIYMLAVLFVALSIPHFNVILSLVGGSLIGCTCVVFPPLFYYLLSRQQKPEDAYGPLPEHMLHPHRPANNYRAFEANYNWKQVSLSLHMKVFLFEIIIFGVGAGVSSTYFAIQSLVTGSSGFTVPCYVNASVG